MYVHFHHDSFTNRLIVNIFPHRIIFQRLMQLVVTTEFFSCIYDKDYVNIYSGKVKDQKRSIYSEIF